MSLLNLLSRWGALFLALPAALPAAEAPATAAGLALLELTRPPGLFVWEAAQRVAALEDAPLREVALTLWRARRAGTLTGAGPLVTEAFAARDPAGAAGAAIRLLRGEVSAPQETGVGLETEAALLWCRLAGHDWPQALRLLDEVPPGDAGLGFWRVAAAESRLRPSRLPAFMAAVARGVPEKAWARILDPALWNAAQAAGLQETGRAVARCSVRSLRLQGEILLEALRKNPPFRGSPPSTPAAPAAEPERRRLLALDSPPGTARGFPFALLKAVGQLPPERALALAAVPPGEPSARGHWLEWMLFMRASEGDPAAAQAVQAETGSQRLRAGHSGAVGMARQPDLAMPAALEALRAIGSPEQQRQAMEGFLLSRTAQDFLTGGQGNPFMAMAAGVQLPADFWRPGLCLAAAGGGGEAVLRLSGGLTWEPEAGRSRLREDILKAWALSRPETFGPYAAGLTNPDEAAPARIAADFAGSLQPEAPGRDR